MIEELHLTQEIIDAAFDEETFSTCTCIMAKLVESHSGEKVEECGYVIATTQTKTYAFIDDAASIIKKYDSCYCYGRKMFDKRNEIKPCILRADVGPKH